MKIKKKLKKLGGGAASESAVSYAGDGLHQCRMQMFYLTLTATRQDQYGRRSKTKPAKENLNSTR